MSPIFEGWRMGPMKEKSWMMGSVPRTGRRRSNPSEDSAVQLARVVWVDPEHSIFLPLKQSHILNSSFVHWKKFWRLKRFYHLVHPIDHSKLFIMGLSPSILVRWEGGGVGGILSFHRGRGNWEILAEQETSRLGRIRTRYRLCCAACLSRSGKRIHAARLDEFDYILSRCSTLLTSCGRN